MNILYITYIDFGNFTSGSMVRPQKIYDAFMESRNEIKLVYGNQNNKEFRKQQVKEIRKWLKNSKPSFCYIESPSYPFLNNFDIGLIKKIHNLKIPILIFYRDAYWKFPEIWGKKGLKKLILLFLYKRDVRIIKKNCDIVYFPSNSMVNLFNFKNSKILMPGCDVNIYVKKQICKHVIYVGGISDRYGTKLLLDAFEIINKDTINIKLNLVCRKNEWDKFSEDMGKKEWLNVYHYSGGEDLKQIYEESDIAVIPFKKVEYMDMAVPVKLFEYLGYGMPIIATNCAETEKIILDFKCGKVCNDNAHSIANEIVKLYSNSAEIEEIKENIKKAVDNNTWAKRVETIINDASNVKKY